MKNKKKVIATYGTFDLLHYGHIRLFKRAKELGDYLIVGISTDEFCKEKNKKPFFSFDIRKEMVKSIKYVDEVIPEHSFDQKFKDFKKYGIDTFVIGNDYAGSDKLNGIEDYCELVILDRTPNISTTDIKKRLKDPEKDQTDKK